MAAQSSLSGTFRLGPFWSGLAVLLRAALAVPLDRPRVFHPVRIFRNVNWLVPSRIERATWTELQRERALLGTSLGALGQCRGGGPNGIVQLFLRLRLDFSRQLQCRQAVIVIRLVIIL